MQIIDRNEAARMIRQSGGKIFSVTFIKRTDRKKMPYASESQLPRRRMVARLGVTQGVTGQGKAFRDSDHDLITAFELVTGNRDAKGRLQNGGRHFRHIPIEGIRELKIAGQEYTVR